MDGGILGEATLAHHELEGLLEGGRRERRLLVSSGEQPGRGLAATNGSRLTLSGARVSLQGPFVNDAAHGFRPEIHPLDSIAYALAADGTPIAVSADDSRWPESRLTWRVAVFTNSTFHRIHIADYLEQDRTITWLLELPSKPRFLLRAIPQFASARESSGFACSVSFGCATGPPWV